MREPNRQSRLKLLWELSKGGRLLYAGAMVLMAVAILCGFLSPQIVMFVVDNLVGGKPMTQPPPVRALLSLMGEIDDLRKNIPLVGLYVLLLSAVGGFCNFLRGRWAALSSEGLIKRLRDRLYSHIQRLPYAWHVKIQTGDIIQRCTSDVDVVRNFIANQLIEMVRTVLLVAFAYIILFPMNFTMALTSFLFLPVILAYSFVFLFKISNRFLKADEAEGQLLSVAQENLTGVRVVRAFGRERHEVDRFQEQNEHFSQLWVKLGNLLSFYWGASDLLTAVQMLALCALGVYEAIAGRLTVGAFMVFLWYNSMTVWPVRGLGRILSEASKTGVSLGRLREILETPAEEDAPDALDETADGDIAFENVSFSYGDAPVLENVSFTVEKGSTLGILGGTGSGKTTVAHLLCRLYDLEDNGGRITIGGKNITEFRRGSLRRSIGIVLQEPFLFSRTIGENIASLSKRHTLEDVRRAAEVSCVGESIEQFAAGYDTIVGERGVTLSGGQKQRVAIARAILKNPPIMIFDDSLSAVDTETDQKIRAALERRTEGATTIIIAHRITSLSRADNIIVLDRGRVAETGTHEELINQNGIYSRVFNLQSSVGEEEAGL